MGLENWLDVPQRPEDKTGQETLNQIYHVATELAFDGNHHRNLQTGQPSGLIVKTISDPGGTHPSLSIIAYDEKSERERDDSCILRIGILGTNGYEYQLHRTPGGSKRLEMHPLPNFPSQIRLSISSSSEVPGALRTGILGVVEQAGTNYLEDQNIRRIKRRAAVREPEAQSLLDRLRGISR